MQTIQLYVEGMRCPRCVREATARLRDLPGVSMLTADRDTGRIMVTGGASATDLLEALAGSSFTAEILAPVEPPGLPGRSDGSGWATSASATMGGDEQRAP